MMFLWPFYSYLLLLLVFSLQILEDCVMFFTHSPIHPTPHSKQIQVMCIHKHRCQSCRIHELIYDVELWICPCDICPKAINSYVFVGLCSTCLIYIQCINNLSTLYSRFDVLWYIYLVFSLTGRSIECCIIGIKQGT